MKIYIDADGCPVVKNTLKIAEKFSVPCVIICDTSHHIEYENSETIIVDKGADSADFYLVNLVQKGDIAITQDYGLAAMCLSKNAVVINQDGWEYTNENISGLLEFRTVSRNIRRNGEKLKGMSKRTIEQNVRFERFLCSLLKLKGDNNEYQNNDNR
ncbi:MAG: YaiI/YqxD family protein [Ruminococcus sp.]|nr:YaiI/YqxD family protein [Ruminococcus sp.]